ncbi:MAG: hypothetical protein COB09_17095 [Thalassobium sp.]|nr:MAG: hypothetical protein COB09_17095 [Thalassobium sp.]
MATAAQVLEASLKRILVQGADAELQADEFSDAIFSMNNYMLDLDAQGVKLGYTVVTSLSDEVTIPLGALRGAIANIAIEISPDYGGDISSGLVRAAESGLKTMQQLGIVLGETAFPSTLPRGSGNYDNSTNSRKYYGCTEEEILSETTGAIGVETGTQDEIDGS